jgi:hypothetical protein
VPVSVPVSVPMSVAVAVSVAVALALALPYLCVLSGGAGGDAMMVVGVCCLGR